MVCFIATGNLVQSPVWAWTSIKVVGHIITVTAELSTMSLLGVKFDKCLTSEIAD